MRHRPASLSVAGALLALAVPAVASASAGEGAGPAALPGASTQRVSVDSAEQQFDDGGSEPAVSASGRYVAFAQNCLAGCVYVRDRVSGITEPISLGDYTSGRPAISADGDQVVFTSIGYGELYLYHRSTDTLENLAPFPVTGCSYCYRPAMSASGALVAFDTGYNEFPGDTNGVSDVFVRDRAAGTTERVSVSSSERQGNGGSDQAAVSASGRYVAFRSAATNLVPGDTNGEDDIFVRDRVAGTTQRVSLSSAEVQGNSYVYDPDISANGQFVAFDAKASNWPRSTGAVLTYVRDRIAGTTEMVSVSSSERVANNVFGGGSPAISDNGRYVTYSSNATNLAPGDTSNGGDVYLRDRAAGTTSLVSVSTSGVKGNGDSRRPAISATARVPVVAFESHATNLVPGDTNDALDVFARKTG